MTTTGENKKERERLLKLLLNKSLSDYAAIKKAWFREGWDSAIQWLTDNDEFEQLKKRLDK